MRFASPPERRSRESVVPMINVVFLLLIFFLISARLAPPDPIEVTPPEAEAGRRDGTGDILYVSAGGDLAYGLARADAVFPALSDRTGDAPLAIRADAALPADEFAALLTRLEAAGITDIAVMAAPVR